MSVLVFELHHGKGSKGKEESILLRTSWKRQQIKGRVYSVTRITNKGANEGKSLFCYALHEKGGEWKEKSIPLRKDEKELAWVVLYVVVEQDRRLEVSPPASRAYSSVGPKPDFARKKNVPLRGCLDEGVGQGDCDDEEYGVDAHLVLGSPAP